jgi:hypothetical protein
MRLLGAALALVACPGWVWAWPFSGESNPIDLTPIPVNNYFAGESGIFSLIGPGTQQITAIGGVVVQQNAQGAVIGPLSGATVAISGGGSVQTDGQGRFQFSALSAGTKTLTVSRTGYYSVQRTVQLSAGESRSEIFQLLAQGAGSGPLAYGFNSPKGKHFLEGLPGSVGCEVTVAWNGTPGTVQFTLGGTKYPATVTDLGGGLAKATGAVPIPTTLLAHTPLGVEVSNGQGVKTLTQPGVHFYPMPPVAGKWLGLQRVWQEESHVYAHRPPEVAVTFWDVEIPSGVLNTHAAAVFQDEFEFDPVAGTLKGGRSGGSKFSLTLEFSGVENIGEGQVMFSSDIDVAFRGAEPPVETPGWELTAQGKAGVGAPVVYVVDIVFPPAAPAVHQAAALPVVGDVLKAARLRLFLIGGLGVSGVYEGGYAGSCWLDTTRLSLSGTLGVEAQALVEFMGCEAGVYAGGTGTPSIDVCPDYAFNGVTLRAYVGVFADVKLFEFSKEVGAEITLGKSGQAAMRAAALLDPNAGEIIWRPIGTNMLQWGEANKVTQPGSIPILSRGGPVPADGPLPEPSESGSVTSVLVTNVGKASSPAILAKTNQTVVLFALHDPAKPWYAATDIGVLRQTNGGAWSLSRIVDDQKAEFTPSITASGASAALAAWVRVEGDISSVTNPAQIGPFTEIVAAWNNLNSGAWTPPLQITANNLVDRDPLAVVFGGTQGVLWIQNEAGDNLGNTNNGDRVMFSSWWGAGWDTPEVLWTAKKGVLDLAFVADGGGSAQVVFAVDEDGDAETRTDRELYRLLNTNGVWQAAVRLTTNAVEDAIPELVAPGGQPLCIWRTNTTLVYSKLGTWNPKPVFAEYTLANEAPTLDATTMSGGAAAVYAVQGTNGIDMVGSFYDASLDRWSLPRQLTEDSNAETAFALGFDGSQLAVAHLSTMTVRTNVQVELNSQLVTITNAPTPGRTDLCLLRHTLGYDMAVVPGSLLLDPVNAAPGSNTTITVTIQNNGDLPVSGIEVVFYDGDPAQGGLQIGSPVIISGVLMGGATTNITINWTVPADLLPHQIYVVVDPSLSVDDRDRANNGVSVTTARADLVLESCRNSEVSTTNALLIARLANSGLAIAPASQISWRLGAANGPEIGRSSVDEMPPGQVSEIGFLWDTSALQRSGGFAVVFAVADAGGVVSEADESNNQKSQSVLINALWPPRITSCEALGGGQVRLVFRAGGLPVSAFTVEGTDSLGAASSWQPETDALITELGLDEYEAIVPATGPTRFYRLHWIPRLLGLEVLPGATVRLLFDPTGMPQSGYVLESSATANAAGVWETETTATITRRADGFYEAQVPVRSGTRFYRLKGNMP